MGCCRRLLPTGLWALGLAACGPAPLPPGPAGTAGFPDAYYRQARALGRPVLEIDGRRSLVAVEVHRAGALARLGHDHVVASHSVQGFIAPQEGRADLQVRLDELVVDETALRSEAGFDTQPSQEAIAGTRRNMLEKVLEAERFPLALIHVTRAGTETLRLAVTLHGVTRQLEVPARLETGADGMTVSGQLSLNQTDFAIAPMSVLGGALQVRDRLDLRFRIVAAAGEAELHGQDRGRRQ